MSSRELVGKPVDGVPGLQYSNLSPEACAAMGKTDVTAWVLALPNDKAAPYVAAIASKPNPPVLLDLSADYRFDSAWQYGLPERFRSALSGAKRISNPGCYATGIVCAAALPVPRGSRHAAQPRWPCDELTPDGTPSRLPSPAVGIGGGMSGAQLSLLPLQAQLGLAAPPSVFGVSGYSGAGTTPSKRNDPAYLQDNLVPYSLSGHMHERCAVASAFFFGGGTPRTCSSALTQAASPSSGCFLTARAGRSPSS